MCDIIVNCTNFKVRINGATALAVPKTRLHYGKNYNEVWNSLLVGLYQANCLTDYNEYNHRDNLLDQVIELYHIHVQNLLIFSKLRPLYFSVMHYDFSFDYATYTR